MKVLTIGMDKDLFKKGSPSCVRYKKYAEKVEEIHAVVFSRKGVVEKEYQIANNAWAYPTNSTNTFMLFYDAYRIGKKLLKQKGAWVITAQDPFESGVVGLLLSLTTGISFQVQEHGNFFHQPYWKAESSMNGIRYTIGLQVVRYADTVRAVSLRIQETLIKIGVKNEKIVVTPVHTELEKFQKAEVDASLEALKKKDEVLILSMARFVPQKNLTLLIRSFIKVLEKGVKAKLVLIGNGEERDLLHTEAEKAPKGSIVFKDWTDTPEKALKSADMYALSSNYEGWGRVCIEALASGTPLLMTDVGCAGEVIIDGVDALVVPIDDEWAFTEGLYKLATDADLRKRLRDEGQKTVSKLPTFEENVALYIESLQKTCGNF